MVNRTSVQAIADMLGGEYDGKTPLAPFLMTANAMVNWVVSVDTADPSRGYYTTQTALPERIECLLGCHYYQLQDPGYQSRSTGGASGSFNYKTEMGFKGSRFGIEAMQCDISGLLQQKQAEMEEGGRRRIQIHASTEGHPITSDSWCE